MGLKDDQRQRVELHCGGKVVDSATLSRAFPRMVFYLERKQTTDRLAFGYTKKQAEIEAQRRAVFALYDEIAKRIRTIAKLDASEAENTKEELGRFINSAEATTRSGKREALIHLFNSLEAVLTFYWNDMEKYKPEIIPDLMQAIEPPLDLLAIEDPVEAARIYRSCKFFDGLIEPDEIYLGHGLIADREFLKEYDTPEKRALYLAMMSEPIDPTREAAAQ